MNVMLYLSIAFREINLNFCDAYSMQNVQVLVGGIIYERKYIGWAMSQ